MKDPYLKIFGRFSFPFLWNFGGQSLWNIPEIKFHLTLNAQYEGKVVTNDVSEMKRCKSNVANTKLDNLFHFKSKSYPFLVENLNSETHI